MLDTKVTWSGVSEGDAGGRNFNVGRMHVARHARLDAVEAMLDACFSTLLQGWNAAVP